MHSELPSFAQNCAQNCADYIACLTHEHGYLLLRAWL